jgi:hypothetical protein
VNKLQRSFLLLSELGPGQLASYAWYRLELRSGRLEKTALPACPPLADPQIALERAFLFSPNNEYLQQRKAEILQQADELLKGQYHPFSGESTRLDFSLPEKQLLPWSRYGDTLHGLDIKQIWEPARFNWVIPLCQAYQIEKNEAYAEFFWQQFADFRRLNPPMLGPNWSSAQEAALHMLMWLLAAQCFASSPATTATRQAELCTALWQHSQRISLTLAYARSQNNNHLLSEALGLMLGGLVFTGTPAGRKWLKTGFHEFETGILHQVEEDGTYSQHSNNYHRLLLHLALLFVRACVLAHRHPSTQVMERLALATRWLGGQLDHSSGQVPNLGHNDGSNLLTFGASSFRDYRPTIQAASQFFLGAPWLENGPWDELNRWLGIDSSDIPFSETQPSLKTSYMRLGDQQTWASLRALRYHSRPAHADQLIVDFWHNGVNLLADAGTYAYNLVEPWQNGLAATAVHNTVTVAHQDQMLRAGKFLWLKRPRAQVVPSQPGSVAAILYCDLPEAYTQIRTIVVAPDKGMVILDQIELAKADRELVPVTIQFLLPDWKWQLTDSGIELNNGTNHFALALSAVNPADESDIPGTLSLIRAGKPLVGKHKNPLRGWISTTYLQKQPALSFTMTYLVFRSLEIKSHLIL